MSMPRHLSDMIEAIRTRPVKTDVHPDIHYLTFATSNWKKALERARRQTGYLQTTGGRGTFDSTTITTERELPSWWFKRVGAPSSVRGFGWYSWKPVIIDESLNRIPDGSMLLYLDAGCTLDETKADQIRTGVETLASRSIDTGMDFVLPTYASTYFAFTKCRCCVSLDMLRFFGLENDTSFLDRFPHWEAGAMLIRNTPAARAFVRIWRDTMLDNLETLFENPDVGLPGFFHNSCDQSVMQCLIYKNRIGVAKANDVFYGLGIYARQRG